jgi:FAD/FMN-containing dehydrogenase
LFTNAASALLTPGQEEIVAMARSMPNWQALQAGIAGEVVLPGSAAYQGIPKPFNARFHDVRPQAIVLCATPQDVAETISFTRRHGLACATRSGGHCFAGRSVTPGLLIDVTPMASVSISGGLATVGAGARLGAVYQSLQVHGLAIPAGTCPPVGVAGLTLGGGLGILGRSYGVTSDRLLAAQVVLADGRVLDCDEHHNQDLFWGLRGAGAGNFGVVTSLRFGTVPAPQVTNFHLTWPPAHAAALIEAWQGWAPLAPDELYASLKLTAADEVDQPASLDVYGALLGSESDATRLLDALVVRAGADPPWAWVEQLSFAETRRFGPSSRSGRPAVGRPPAPQRRSPRIWLPSRSSSGGRCPPRPPPHWWSTSSRADLQASSASWTSARGGAPTTACQPMPAPLSIAMRCSSSSTRSWSTPKPPRMRSRPRIGG